MKLRTWIMAMAAGGLSANGWPRDGDVVAMLALPDNKTNASPDRKQK